MFKTGSVVELVRDTHPMGKAKNGSTWPCLTEGTQYTVLGSYEGRSDNPSKGTWYQVRSLTSGAEFEFHQDILKLA